MNIEIYDTVLLKNGKTAVILDIWARKDMIKVYEADVRQEDEDTEQLTIKLEDIEKVIRN